MPARYARREPLGHFGRDALTYPLGEGETRRDDVDQDAVAAQFPGQAARQPGKELLPGVSQVAGLCCLSG